MRVPNCTIPRTCHHCSKEFFVPKGVISETHPCNFCTRRCFYEHKKTFRTERFWSFVEIGKENDCWIWTGGKRRGGYGAATHPKTGKQSPASRVAYEITKSDVPEGMVVMHSCDNPACCNPNHLSVGTALDNSRDMISKSRSLTGEKNHKSKIKESDVIEIRRMYSTGSTCISIASKYGISISTAHRIAIGKIWKLQSGVVSKTGAGLINRRAHGTIAA